MISLSVSAAVVLLFLLKILSHSPDGGRSISNSKSLKQADLFLLSVTMVNRNTQSCLNQLKLAVLNPETPSFLSLFIILSLLFLSLRKSTQSSRIDSESSLLKLLSETGPWSTKILNKECQLTLTDSTFGWWVSCG